MCHRGACKRDGKKEISVKTVRIVLRGLSSAWHHAVVLAPPEHCYIRKSPTTFHSSIHLFLSFSFSARAHRRAELINASLDTPKWS
jgi:hypothetical protein